MTKICNSPYCQPYNSYEVSAENLVLDQLIIPEIDSCFYSHHLSAWFCIVLYWYCKEKFSISHSRELKG